MTSQTPDLQTVVERSESVGRQNIRFRPGRAIILVLVIAAWLMGCASSGKYSKKDELATIPEGKGVLILYSGGIPELDFRVVDQATDEVVVKGKGLQAFLEPGVYKVVVDTDLNVDDPVAIERVTITAGQLTHVEIPIGRFRVIVYGNEGASRPSVRMRFMLWDDEMSKILLKGMSALYESQHLQNDVELTKYFVVPEGDYKIQIVPLGYIPPVQRPKFPPHDTEEYHDLTIRFGHFSKISRTGGYYSHRVEQFNKDGTVVSLQYPDAIPRMLRKGMPEDTIRRLLGEPIRIQKDGPWEYWYYSDDRIIEIMDYAVTSWKGF